MTLSGAAAELTAALQEALGRAEELICAAPFVRTEQDLMEGYHYLAGRLRAAVQDAFERDPRRPVLVNSTHQYARQGLDNPDALYFHAYLTPGTRYSVRGVRGSTADLSFQVLGGGYDANSAPPSLLAFDDRDLDVQANGEFSYDFTAAEGARMLIVREVYSDWDAEQRGTLWIECPDQLGATVPPPDRELTAKRYAAVARNLTGMIETWLAFPDFFQNKEPVNTLTVPASTPGGLAAQRSSIGHYALALDEALIVTVPACQEAGYQGIQIGADWYISTDYESHQTSLTAAQAHTDPDGMLRFVISETPPLDGAPIANWLETTGHRTGPMMLRWQRLTRDLGAADGPQVQLVPLAEVAAALPYPQPLTQQEYATRIAARQRAVARRMLG